MSEPQEAIEIDRNYFDQDGKPCTLEHLTKEDPRWAASRIRVGDQAIKTRNDLISTLEMIINEFAAYILIDMHGARPTKTMIRKYRSNARPDSPMGQANQLIERAKKELK